MPAINVILNGRTYTVACDVGEEDHVRDLGQFLDQRVSELTSSLGQVGDARLLLMAGLTIADELRETRARVQERDHEIATLKAEISRRDGEGSEDRAAALVDHAASRVEAIAARIARS